MKDKFKKIFNVVFGSDKDIPFKIATSLFITSLILSIFTWIYRENSLRLTFFTYVSSISFSFWLIFSYGIDTSAKIAYEAFRLIIFFPIFIISIYYLLPNSSNNIFIIILSCFGIFFSCIYFSSKLDDTINFIKILFKKLKIKIFNTENTISTGFKSVLENITVFLVSIGGFLIAIKTIVEVIFQIVNFFKP